MSTRISEFGQVVKAKYSQIIEQLREMKLKIQNLPETNFNLGLKHLNNGKSWDAYFRFKLMKIFWPDNLDAKYWYAYCLVLLDREAEARMVLENILEKDSKSPKAKDLLTKIKSGESSKIRDEYRKKHGLDEEEAEE